MPLIALVGMLLAGRYVVQADQGLLHRATIVVGAETAEVRAGVQVIQRADLFQDLIDLLQEIIDILDDRITFIPPDKPILTDEERDDANDATDEAENEGVDTPEERIEANWQYEETRAFLVLVIDRINEFLEGPIDESEDPQEPIGTP